MRLDDRDLIRGGHYGQRSCEPHQKAEHMAAPTNPAKREESSCQPGAVHTWHVEGQMGLNQGGDSEARFAAYVSGLASVIGHRARTGPLRDYCTGLMLPGERKSVEPMAARTAPSRTAAQHQSLLHFVGIASWSDEKVLAKVREMVLPSMQRHGPIEAWIIDDTGFPKQG